MAASTVFQLPELAEAIFIHLPFRALLKARAINKSCKALIEESVSLRRILHLTPLAEGPLQLNTATTSGFTSNTDPSIHYPFLYGHVPTSIPILTRETCIDGFYFDKSRHLDTSEGLQNYSAYVDCPQDLLELAKTSEQSIWRSMFLTQPPCAFMSISLFNNILCRHNMWIRDPQGIKLGHIADLYQLLVVQHQNNPCSDGELHRDHTLMCQFGCVAERPEGVPASLPWGGLIMR